MIIDHWRRLLRQSSMLLIIVTLWMGVTCLPLHAEVLPEEVTAVDVEQAPAPLTTEELQVLVARIALYPDELVALISAASLYPLQIVEADRFLEEAKTKPGRKPKSAWDGSVISLLNYPEVVNMMSDDLDWTQLLGEAIVNQQDDVLVAIQQLREEAVANDVIKSDEKVKIVKEQDNIIIQPASTEVVYVPQYEPEMLYDDGFDYRPIAYYPEPRPLYWSPAATFFAGAVTGVIWAAAVDWDDGFWGGDWDWGDNDIDIDIDIDCNRCIIGSDFDGRLRLKDVDWRKVDRTKIAFDKNKLDKVGNKKLKDSFKKNDKMQLKDKVAAKPGSRPGARPGQERPKTKDIRKSTLDKMKNRPVKDFGPSDKMARPGNGVQKPKDKMARPDSSLQKPKDKMARPGGDLQKPKDKMTRPVTLDRPVGKPRPAEKVDRRPTKVSPLGDVTRSRDALKQSKRGNKSMGSIGKRPKIGGSGGSKAKKKFIPKPKKGGSSRKRR